MNSWVDTLQEFLESSNEDEKISQLFTDEILPRIIKKICTNELRWMEIGPGNGIKTKNMVLELDATRTYELLNVTICEPCMKWLFGLNNPSYLMPFSDSVNMNFLNKTFEYVVDNEIAFNYNFISVIQLLYYSNIKNSLIKFIDEKPLDLETTIWIDVEDESSDFNKMRELLIQKGENPVISYLIPFLEDLHKRNIPYEKFYTSNKTCHINIEDIMTDDDHWIFSFVMGIDSAKYKLLSERRKAIILSEIRNYLQSKNKEMLDINDVSILISV